MFIGSSVFNGNLPFASCCHIRNHVYIPIQSIYGIRLRATNKPRPRLKPPSLSVCRRLCFAFAFLLYATTTSYPSDLQRTSAAEQQVAELHAALQATQKQLKDAFQSGKGAEIECAALSFIILQLTLRSPRHAILQPRPRHFRAAGEPCNGHV